MAVLGAAAGLDGDDPFDLDIGTAPHPDPMRELEELGDLRVGNGPTPRGPVLVVLALLEYLRTSGGGTSVTGGTSRRVVPAAEVCRIEAATERRTQPARAAGRNSSASS